MSGDAKLLGANHFPGLVLLHSKEPQPLNHIAGASDQPSLATRLDVPPSAASVTDFGSHFGRKLADGLCLLSCIPKGFLRFDGRVHWCSFLIGEYDVSEYLDPENGAKFRFF